MISAFSRSFSAATAEIVSSFLLSSTLAPGDLFQVRPFRILHQQLAENVDVGSDGGNEARLSTVIFRCVLGAVDSIKCSSGKDLQHSLAARS